ncbi:sigma-70 family RNA polymerase sigma factor [Nocardia sp. NBC_00565]|uniref:sigma-70 family RNA polymerase sigma factor n=1 Tax=Nocardia sp. NBC_00565 TaxID=2975993 RepID=UPI002E811063|nr:sigma-70 family RNA polymerase sigma factor [Nocardia sp. NBC_00565]WUC05223.1 sigma-70 family RNA polymerase sigma factor [Nocardia sp. NBC_00565]
MSHHLFVWGLIVIMLAPQRPERISTSRGRFSRPHRDSVDTESINVDPELVHRVGGGDQAAFAELYRRTHGLVYRRVLAIVRDRGYAEETCHDVYLEVWRCAVAFDEHRGSVLTWLRMLAHRQAVDRVRHERAVLDHNHSWGSRDYQPPTDVVAEEALRRDERAALRKSLTNLTALQHESIALAYYSGLTYPQVAARLGVGLPTVKSRIRAGLEHLKTDLTDHREAVTP